MILWTRSVITVTIRAFVFLKVNEIWRVKQWASCYSLAVNTSVCAKWLNTNTKLDTTVTCMILYAQTLRFILASFCLMSYSYRRHLRARHGESPFLCWRPRPFLSFQPTTASSVNSWYTYWPCCPSDETSNPAKQTKRHNSCITIISLPI